MTNANVIVIILRGRSFAASRAVAKEENIEKQMAYVIIFMHILGGMGALLIGMKALSENLTKLAHSKLKGLLDKTAKTVFPASGSGQWSP